MLSKFDDVIFSGAKAGLADGNVEMCLSVLAGKLPNPLPESIGHHFGILVRFQ